jgi:uncharacterized coiled-coil DUF342 family protein
MLLAKYGNISLGLFITELLRHFVNKINSLVIELRKNNTKIVQKKNKCYETFTELESIYKELSGLKIIHHVYNLRALAE